MYTLIITHYKYKCYTLAAGILKIMRVLVTGGAGYIGSHTILALKQAGFEPVIVDNFGNADRGVIERLEHLTGSTIMYHEADCSDAAALARILQESPCEGLIHFAAFKAVGESVEEPLKYYRNNVANFVNVLEVAAANGVKHVVFSSTAAVYGTPETSTVTEESPTNPESPYGWSKRMDEIVLRDFCAATPGLAGTMLRYFNVVGADASGDLGESSRTKPQNLLPVIVEAVSGKRDKLVINGNDYPTKDGTCERDYVHVSDLAAAHVAALQRDIASQNAYEVFNVSTGKATSIMELINTFERVNGVKVPYEMGPRRPGDPAAYYAIADKANRLLGWQAVKTVEDACRDAWQWQTNHPNGYGS